MFDDDHIDKYLNDQLMPSDRKSFEAALNGDLDLRERVEYLRGVRIAAKQLGRARLDQRFIEIDNKLDNSPTSRPSQNRSSQWIAIAAGILLLIAAVWYFSKGTPENAANDLFAEYFEPFPNIIAPNLRGKQQELTPIQAAMLAYDQKDFDRVVDLMKNQNAVSDTLQFYVGVAHLAADRPERAIQMLQKLSSNVDFRFHEATQWYLALAALSEDDMSTANDLLTTIAKDATHRYYEEALQLKKEIGTTD